MSKVFHFWRQGGDNFSASPLGGTKFGGGDIFGGNPSNFYFKPNFFMEKKDLLATKVTEVPKEEI